jgi:hypothetical protein
VDGFDAARRPAGGEPEDSAGTGEPGAGERRRPSRADSLRLSRIPPRPLRQPADQATRTPSAGFAAFGTTAPPRPAPEVTPPEARPGAGKGRRWWIAALALALLVGFVPAYRWIIGDEPVDKSDAVVPPPAIGSAPPEMTASQPAAPSVAAGAPSAGAQSAGAPSAGPTPPGSPTASVASPAPPTKPPAGKPNPSGANLALQGTATASGSEGDPWLPRFACDGDTGSRWSSAFADPQWIRVDLRQSWQLTEVTLVWERAYGVRYRVDTSLDGKSWRTLWSTTSGRGGTVRVDAKGAAARYVRMYGTQRSGQYGYSLLELEIR